MTDRFVILSEHLSDIGLKPPSDDLPRCALLDPAPTTHAVAKVMK